MAKHDNKGRSKRRSNFILLDGFLMKTKAWQALKPCEIAVYILICQRYNGRNNGYISLSVREVCSLAHIAPGTAKKAFKRLVELGFIKCRHKGAFSVKTKKASEWELTFWPGKNGQRSSHDYRHWKPQKKNTGAIHENHKVKITNIVNVEVITGTKNNSVLDNSQNLQSQNRPHI